MKTRFLGGSLAALLLALALAGCGGKTGTTTTTDVSSASSAGSSSDALVTVGSSQVTRGELDTFLEGALGQQALPQLIDLQLLTEALKAKGGSVSDDEISAEVARLAQAEPAVKAAVDAGGARAQVPRQQARRTLTTAKLLTQGVPADDAKVQAFFKQYAAYYGTPLQVRLGILASSTKARADILARAVTSKPDSFNTLVDQQKKTNDPLGSQSTVDTGRFQPVDQALGGSPALATINKLLVNAKKGQVLPLQALSPKGPFLLVRVVDRQEAVQPDFAKIKDQVTLDYKMAQVAQPVVKANPSNPGTLEQNIKQIIAALGQPNPQTGAPGIKASLRDALNYILQGPAQAQLVQLRSNGSVQISDLAYQGLAPQYRAVSTANTAATTGNSATGTTTNSAAPATSGATNSAASATSSATNSAAPAASSATNSAAPATSSATNSAAPATSGTTTNSAAPATSSATNSAAPAKP